MKKKTSIAYLGFSLYLFVEVLSFHSSIAFSETVGAPALLENNYFGLLTATRALTYLIICLVTFRASSFRRTKRVSVRTTLVLVCTFASCLGLVFVVAFNAKEDTLVIPFIGVILFGASQAILGLYWLSSLTSLDYRKSYFYLLASHALATVLCALLLFLSASLFLPVMILSLLTSNVLLLRMPPAVQTTQSALSQVPYLAPRLGKAVLVVCIFALASGFMTMISSGNYLSVDPVFAQYTVLGISGVVLVVMLIPTLIFKHPLNIESGYRTALPLSALGFLILPGLTDFFPPFIAGTLTTTGYMITGIILYCSIAEVVRAAKISPYPLYAASEAFTSAFTLIGMFAGYNLAANIEHLDFGLALVAAGSLYLLVLCASWLFSRNKKESPDLSFERKVSEGETQTKFFSEQKQEQTFQPLEPLESIAKRFKLSTQEETIFVQLVEGRNLPRIARDLFLSTGAVKYHTQKIYRSFDVHSRSELLEAVAHIQKGLR